MLMLRSLGTLEPELSKCRTSIVGSTIPGTDCEMFYCRIYNADCKYAVPFGYDYLCRHPEGRHFLIPEDADPETPVYRRANSRDL